VTGGLRAVGAGQIKGWPGDMSFTPLVGFEVALDAASWLQIRPQVRAGYQLGNGGSHDLLDTSACAHGLHAHAEECFVLQGVLAATLAETLRLQLVYEESPLGPQPYWTNHLLAELGVQFNWPLGSFTRPSGR
jgi:hypothetical protein